MITSITITILQYDQESFINFPFEETVSEIDLDQPALCNFNYTHAIILCVNSSAVFFIFYPKKKRKREESIPSRTGVNTSRGYRLDPFVRVSE